MCVIIVCVLVLGCLVSSGCLGLCDYLCGMGKYMARTCLIKAGIMMTEGCLVSLSNGDWYVSHGCMQRC